MNALCPTTSTPGRKVGARTVRSLVREARAHEVDGQGWFYCEAPGCEVVYFTADGVVLSRSDLRVRVGAKEVDAPHTVCYCFDHSEETLRDEIARTGGTTAFESISARIRAGECRCVELNPKGVCCLGDVRAVIDRAMGPGASDR